MITSFIRTSIPATIALALALGAAGPALADVSHKAPKPQPADGDGPLAPLLEGLGDHHRAITTTEPMAQRFFDQALVLTYGFNHAEAARAFQEAARLDPSCAMCFWGEALVLGPNINSPMDPESVARAFEATQQALALAEQTSPVERELAQALAARYAPDPPEDRSALDMAYADAMREVWKRHPEDVDVGALFAESLMDTTPWDYWEKSGEPKGVMGEALASLERVIELDPQHPGANHYYIHAVEAVHPDRGVAAAERLAEVAPGAGHLVHMPSHIYIRVGRYQDASAANELAIAADAAYQASCHAQGLYPLGYVPHNFHFLSATATFEGRSQVAQQAAAEVKSRAEGMMREPDYLALQHFWLTPFFGQLRFGLWGQVLAEPDPGADMLYPRGIWHYGRGLALARTGRLDDAAKELAATRAIAADPVLAEISIWDLHTTDHLLAIGVETLAGEIAAGRQEFEAAVKHLEKAVELQDSLLYDEPPPWYQPVRLVLGAVLLEAGRLADAEHVYREELAMFPKNGWALIGLQQSLAGQGEAEAAAKTGQDFAAAWSRADLEIAGSRF